MKRLNFILLMILCTTISFGQVSNEADNSIIKNLIVESFDEIWSKLDSKNISKYYSNDFLLLENGLVWNNDSIIKYLDIAILQKPIPKRVNTIEVVEIKISNKMAWVAYQNYATFSIHDKIMGKAHWLESATAILTEKGWKLDMLHSTPVNVVKE
jgi:hypothetical protein